ncbi:MAG: peroxiredoxin [Paracoccaceae bacterium]
MTTTDTTTAATDAPGAGEPARPFVLPASDGRLVSLADLAGHPFVLYFYPKDDTSGCTKEALAFSAAAPDFAALGARVLGVSKDPVAAHERFVAKHGLDLVLLSDADGDVCERYGVWREKSMYGRRFMGIERATFLIDADGTIRRVWRKVRVPGHAEAVLHALREI